MGESKRRGATKALRVAALLDKNGVVQMTAERYNAYVAWTRSPIAANVGIELEFFSDKPETLIGVLIKDRFDRDFGFVILGRDRKRRFRCIDVGHSMSKTDARHGLFASIKRHIVRGKTIYPQDDENTNKAGVDLFTSVRPVDQQHPLFNILCTRPHWAPARAIMSEMMHHFIDVDGNFVEQFQTTAFDSRIWELYLYAALLELRLFVNKKHEAPDFEVANGRSKVYIEAVIVGPSPHDPPFDSLQNGKPRMRVKSKFCCKFPSFR